MRGRGFVVGGGQRWTGATTTMTQSELEMTTQRPADYQRPVRDVLRGTVLRPFTEAQRQAASQGTARFGNDPEHIQAFTPARLRRLLGASFERVEVHKVFPWLVAVGSRPRAHT